MKNSWTQHLVCRKEVWKTTWTLRVALLLLLAGVVFPTKTYWLTRVGRSLVHDDVPTVSDAIVLENYDANYLVFETAARLLRQGCSERLLVPTAIHRDPDMPNAVSKGFVDVMTRIARIDNAELIPVGHAEPITLTVATQVAKTLRDTGVRSVIVVSPTFRSQRSFEVYSAVLAPLEIAVSCIPSGGTKTPGNWWKTTHGLQMVFLEFVKLHYYRIFILPCR